MRAESTASTLIGRRYILHDRLGQGGMGTVYRAVDRLTGHTVALKRVLTGTYTAGMDSSRNLVDFRMALAQEFKMLSSLRHPHIIQVLDYGFDLDREPYYTMELLNDALTVLDAAKGQPLKHKIELMVQMLQALAYLHRRGVLHRDLKPANVLVHEDRVKLLDFGLSVMRDRSTTDEEDANLTAGTLAYMAPEILMGHPSSEISDLYSVGVMAYELLAGRHPFDTSEIGPLVNSILYSAPDIDGVDVSVGLGQVLARLLTKVPEERYQSAAEVIRALDAAVDYEIPVETEATRESYLQAARLVGRESELDRLTSALKQALKGEGAVWLIGGESGVGKSRLVDELRTRALVEGALVMSGQAVSDTGVPYQVWRMPFGWQPLLRDLSSDDAAIIKSLMPDVPTLNDYTAENGSTPDPIKARGRLLHLLEQTLRQQSQPVVIILEDLHWAGSESLALLHQLSELVAGLRLLVIASYRDDERPDLPSLLPNVPVMKLQRLSEQNIAELSQAMLGETGAQAQVVDLLQRETEGNVFFIIEVIRALAEEAGQLEQIGWMTLPQHVFAGGVRRIVRHRLDRLPAYTHRLLQYAAVMGRQQDLRLLHTLAAQEAIDLDQWLTDCANAAVLEVTEGQWRFTHDKLREGVLETLVLEERRELHRRIATTIESLYEATAERAIALAHHWGQGADRERERIYTALAGAQSVRSGAYREAVAYLQRALDLLPETGAVHERIPLLHGLAEAHLGFGSYDEAAAFYYEALTLAEASADLLAQAGTLYALGNLDYALGHFDEAQEHYQHSLDLYERLNDSVGIARALNSLGNIAYEQGDQTGAKHYYRLSRESGGQWGMAGAMRSGDASEAVRDSSEMRQLLETLETEAISDDPGRAAETFFQIGEIARERGQYPQARLYLRQALENARDAHSENYLLRSLMSLAQVFVAQGEYEIAVELLAFLLYHPASPEALQDEAERIAYEVQPNLPAGSVEALWERGKSRDLTSVVSEMCALLDQD